MTNQVKTNNKIYNDTFAIAYIICACIIFIVNFLLCIVEGNAIIDTMTSTSLSLIMGTILNIDSFMFLHIDGVGPFAILLILHFGIVIYRSINSVFSIYKKRDKFLLCLLLLFVTVATYFLSIFVFKKALPLSILEGCILANLLFLFSLIIRHVSIKENMMKTVFVVLSIAISISGFLYLYIPYFLDI